MKHVVMAFIAFVIGFFLMGPLAYLFDKMDWPLFQSGELAHVTFVIAWPLLTLLSLGDGSRNAALE